MRKETRGSTLVELMVAVVLLAIVVMFIALVPTQSQQMMLKADRVSAASAAARDKMENFRHVIGRTGPNYRGYNVLMSLYPSGMWAGPDTFKYSEIKVLRKWQFTWPGGLTGDSAKGSVDLRCYPLSNGALTAESLRICSWVAKRDTFIPF
jgi:prepilin-type N-terminal cleavage/methylation domain-containing protein